MIGPVPSRIFNYRYVYYNKLYAACGSQHGILCDPVKNERGKCVVGRGSQLVDFEDGERAVVIRRCLRVNKKQLELFHE